MSTEHHDLDPYPVPQDGQPLFVNEPWLIDESVYAETYSAMEAAKLPSGAADNVRIYVPLDLNREAILRRLNHIIDKYGEANESNESDFCQDVSKLVSQIEIYDQVWYVRHVPVNSEQKHSSEAVRLVRDFVRLLEDIPDGCAECFPFSMIDELTAEYLG